MNKLYLAMAALFLLLTTCKKETNAAHTTQSVPAVPDKTATIAATTATAANTDTLPNRTQLKLKLVLDSIHTDETALLFVKMADSNYNSNEDARYFPGLGLENLASITPDGFDLAINTLPYIPNQSIGLYVYGKNDGAYLLKISYETTLPSNLCVWLKDSLTKDSLNLRTGNYKFNISKADTTTYGGNRFRVILRAK